MSASYRVSKADMEASRLVFVMLRGAKPMRKVAIPIMEGMSFEAFQSQVRGKLRIEGIQDMTLVTTGEQVTDLSQVQDIDQIEVVQQEDAAAVSSAPSYAQRNSLAVDPRTQPGNSASSSRYAGLEDDRNKYVKRKGALQGWLQRYIPGLQIPPRLPVTRRDTDGAGPSGSMRGRRRKARSILEPRNMLAVLIFVLILLVLSMFYMRALQGGTDTDPDPPRRKQRRHDVADDVSQLHTELPEPKTNQQKPPVIREPEPRPPQERQEQPVVRAPDIHSPDEHAPDDPGQADRAAR